jgi:cytochrome c oxidase subunit 1
MFLFNLAWSAFKGRQAGGNPWRATTLEWQTPDTPPVHGNWGPRLPVVYRWPYDYSVPGADQDFLPQNLAPVAVTVNEEGKMKPAARWLTLLRGQRAPGG